MLPYEAAVHQAQAGGGGGVVGILIVIAVIGFGVLSWWNNGNRTKCIHCGHDNGLRGHQHPVCPACGLNKTIANKKKARKR